MILDQVAGKAAEIGLPYLLIGGHAVNYHGYSRLTDDVDLLIKRDALSDWTALLNSFGYSLRHEAGTFCQFEKKDSNEPGIDLMLVNEQTFEKLSGRAQNKQEGGVHFQLVCVEHLIALKLHALKQDLEHRRVKDFLDVVELVRANGIDLRSEEMRQIFERYGTEDLYRRIQLGAA